MEESADRDAARAFINGRVVSLALRKIEFQLLGLHVNVRVRLLPEINFRSVQFDVGRAGFNRHVRKNELRHAFGRELVRAVHRHAVAVRVDQLFVNPRARLFRQLRHVQLARRNHHLPDLPVDLVTINVNILKIIIRSNPLNLLEGVAQSRPIPEAYVVERLLIVLIIEARNRRVCVEVAYLYAFELETFARPGDVVFDVRRLASQLVRLDDETLDISWNNHPGDDIGENRQRDCRDNDSQFPDGERVYNNDEGSDD